ncbi:MAG: hypothetical protein LKI22_03365 [Liquorilactobacillus nagelii]|jgi:DNA polymerase III sliding clamp (beta) subunit (PCNA family)|uniref:hypothetical protein n=1 Tax=Liquorilactobacillus nagelii TaxID=82688 RepID=UPI0024307E86|nr:hypothetical protein [Liquorilactobacillus nagelii]MCI1632977.1 hypothetical protein [Liquorilactobacillus nagelii]
MKINAGIEKCLKNVIKNAEEELPILQCVHFEGGNIIATDSHQLVRFRNAAPKNLNFNLNLTNFTFCDAIYPDTERLIPTKFATEFEISAEKVIDLIPFLKSLPKNFINCTKMSVSKEKVVLESEVLNGSDIGQRLSINIENFSGKETNICFKSELLVNALESVKELKQFGNVQFKLQESKLMPFLLVYKNMDYLLTPVRAS